jgi:MerR family transcriptional regulator, copper efflux regulator
MDRVKLLVGLWQDKNRPSREVKDIALRQIADLEAKISELAAMKDALAALAVACHGDNRPDCPILSDMAGVQPTQAHPVHPNGATTSPGIRHRRKVLPQ